MLTHTLPRWRWLMLAPLLLLHTALAAHDYQLGELRIVHPFAAPTAPGLSQGVVYLDLHNQGGQPARLLGARAHIAATVELHQHLHDGALMRMRPIEAIELAAGELLRMRPGAAGYHLMLLDLKAPLREGERFPLWLRFEGHREQRVEVWVEAAAAGSHAADGHHH